MDMLLAVGLFFPVISVLTLALSWWGQRRTGKYSSAVLIPIIGPTMLSLWIEHRGIHRGWIPLVWLGDPGSLSLLIILPRLLREWWQISSLTEFLRLASDGDQPKIRLSLHRTSRYRLQVCWPPTSSPGPVTQSEVGFWSPTTDGYRLTTDGGDCAHTLLKSGDTWQFFRAGEPLVTAHFDGDRTLSSTGWKLLVVNASGGRSQAE